MNAVEQFIVDVVGASARHGGTRVPIHCNAGGFFGRSDRAPTWREGCDAHSPEPHLELQGDERSAAMILAFAVAVVAAATYGILNLVSWARGV
jgi:ribosomal protein L4